MSPETSPSPQRFAEIDDRIAMIAQRRLDPFGYRVLSWEFGLDAHSRREAAYILKSGRAAGLVARAVSPDRWSVGWS